MKKTIKKKIFIGALLTTGVAITIYSSINLSDSSPNSAAILYQSDETTTTVVSDNDAPLYNPTQGPVISGANARNLWQTDSGPRDPNLWYSTYVNHEFDDYDPAMAYQLAKVYGWSQADYDRYVHYHYEVAGDPKNNEFGTITGANESWIAWHPDTGLISRGGTSMTFMDGHESPIKPSYDGAELMAYNHIDNDLTWYGYQDQMKTFVFDQNNLENTFKRLSDESLKRLILTTPGEILNEVGATDVEGLNQTSRKDQGGFVILNGQFHSISDLDPSFNYYYVTVNGQKEENFIRDEHGWKVVVSDGAPSWGDPDLSREAVLDKIFTTVLNPIDQNGHLVTILNGSVTDAQGHALVQGDVDLSDNQTVLYDSTYGFNEQYKPTDDLTAFATSSQGTYRMAYQENSWLDLVQNRAFVLPDQLYVAPHGGIANKDRQYVDIGHNFWEGGALNWVWAEDGQGGHKIYKKINILSPRAWSDELTDEQKSNHESLPVASLKIEADNGLTHFKNKWSIVEARLFSPLNPAHRFWGNYHHVFWSRDSFYQQNNIIEDGGY